MRVRNSAILTTIASASCLHTAHAFAPPRSLVSPSPSSTSPSLVVLSAVPPTISNWKYQKDGTVTGIVTNHPTIPDGSPITTSPIKNPEKTDENSAVQTRSGSRYKLSAAARGAKIPAAEARLAKEKERRDAEEAKANAKAAAAAAKVNAAAAKAGAAADKVAAAAAAKSKAAAKKKSPTPAPAKKQPPPKKMAQPKKAAPVAVAVAAAVAPAGPSEAELCQSAKAQYALVGKTVGPNGKYLLAGQPRQSNGRQAKIWTAYLADKNVPDLPAGYTGNIKNSKVKPLTIKLSPDAPRLAQENKNYDRVQTGLFSGMFVKKSEYLASAPSSDRSLDRTVAALVIESGESDLKALLASRGGRPLAGRALRDAACSAGQCIQGVHSSGLVWTDLKTENFIVVGSDKDAGFVYDGSRDDGGKSGLKGVKGIDLESAIPRGGNPIDYSPEACPPEFARVYAAGTGADFVLDYSYDMWSLGMMLFELSTGQPYFGRATPAAVTSILCNPNFEVDVSAIPDPKLKDLIGKCLSLDPKKRPDITGFLLHPFFTTTGFFSFSF